MSRCPIVPKSCQQNSEDLYDSLGNLKTVNYPNDIHHDKNCNKDFWRKHRKQRKDFRIDYIVDGMGRRVGKKINGKLTQQFVWQSQLQIAAELDSAGRVMKQFVYGSKVNVPDYMLMSGRTYSIITDQLGSPRVVVDALTGKIAQEIEYDEFGVVVKDSAPGFTPFGFAGGLYDQDIRLVRFGARDYDPEVGRWTSKDPIGFAGGENLYRYALQDPINVQDLNGENPILLIGIAAGILLTPTPVDTFITPFQEVVNVAAGAALGALTGAAISIGIELSPVLLNNRYVRVGEGKFPEPFSKRISIGNTPGKKLEIGMSKGGRIEIKIGSSRFNITKTSNKCEPK